MNTDLCKIMRYPHQEDRRKGSECMYMLEVERGLESSARELKSQLPREDT